MRSTPRGNTLEKASIAYSTPETLRLGDTATIQLLLSRSESVGELKGQLTEPGPSAGERIRVSERMEAHLSGPGFKIEAIIPDDHPQKVEDEGVNEWRWDVTAVTPGEQRLHLVLNAVVLIDGEETNRFVRTFDRQINVRVTVLQQAANFLGGNWQWLWTVAVVPAAGYFLARAHREQFKTWLSSRLGRPGTR